MADIKISLEWDIEDGNLVFFAVSKGQEIGSIIVDAETIYDSFIMEKNSASGYSEEEWGKFIGKQQDMLDAISYRMEHEE